MLLIVLYLLEYHFLKIIAIGSKKHSFFLLRNIYDRRKIEREREIVHVLD